MHADYIVQETLCTVHALFTGRTTTLFKKKILKMGPTVLFTHLKIILLQYFVFLVFSFQQNKLYPNGPLVLVYVIRSFEY